MSAVNTNTYKHNTLSISCGGRIKIGISLKKTSQELDSQPIAVSESILHVFQEQKLCQQKLVQFVRPPRGYKMVQDGTSVEPIDPIGWLRVFCSRVESQHTESPGASFALIREPQRRKVRRASSRSSPMDAQWLPWKGRLQRPKMSRIADAIGCYRYL
jgi:hypothetical protein